MDNNLKDIKNKVKLIATGNMDKINPPMTYLEKVQIQTDFKKYPEHVIKFISELKEKDINFTHHLSTIDSLDLTVFAQEMFYKGINLKSIPKENKILLKSIHAEKWGVINNILSKEERTKAFNDYMNNAEADYYLENTVFSNLQLSKKIEIGNIPIRSPNGMENYRRKVIIENNNDFSIIKRKISDNMEKFSKLFDTEKIVSHSNYENYLLGSFFVSKQFKELITTKNFLFEDMFESLEPILPMPDKKKSFVNIIISTFFNNKVTVEIDKFNPLLNDLTKYIKDNSIKVDVTKFINQHGILSLKVYQEATGFIEYLKEHESKELLKIEKNTVSHTLNHNISNVLNIADIKTQIEILKPIIKHIKQEDSNFNLDINELFTYKLKEIKNNISKQIEFDIFKDKYNKIPKNNNEEDKKVFQIFANIIASEGEIAIFNLKEFYKDKDNMTHHEEILNNLFKLDIKENKVLTNTLKEIDDLMDNFKDFLTPYLKVKNKSLKLK